MRPALAVLLIALLGATAAPAEPAPETLAPDDPVPEAEEAPPGGDFTLMSDRGPVALQDLRGRVVALYFGYTKCPDVCPTSLAFLAAALHGLEPAELAQVQPILISIDPERDTPQRLKDYAVYFHPALIGLTGSEAEVAAVAKLYGAKYFRAELEDSAFGYAINHSAATYLIDQDGTLRFVFPHQTPASVMLEAMRYLLAGN